MPNTNTGTLLTTELPPLVLISPDQTDHSFLHQIIGSSWRVINTSTLNAGLAAMRDHRAAIVLCECDLQPGSWKDVLAETLDMSSPPRLIVTSRLADEALWAEALNLGAYDVLAKPFDTQEVQRVARMAWEHWGRENQSRPRPMPAQPAPLAKKSKKSSAAGRRYSTRSEGIYLIA